MPAETTDVGTRSSTHGLRDVDLGELIRRWQRGGDGAARTEVVNRYLPLAGRLARRYPNPCEAREDLSQFAAVGLLLAIDRFDPDHGARFQSFAVPTILGELRRHFRDTGWMVHVPRRAKELALLTERSARELTTLLGRAPSVPELADHLQLSIEAVVVGLDARTAHYATSLDAPASATETNDPQPLVDCLGTTDDRLDLVDAKLSLADALARLPHLERTALRLRAGHGLRQTDVAAQMDCPQTQISRLLRRAALIVWELIDPALASPQVESPQPVAPGSVP